MVGYIVRVEEVINIETFLENLTEKILSGPKFM